MDLVTVFCLFECSNSIRQPSDICGRCFWEMRLFEVDFWRCQMPNGQSRTRARALAGRSLVYVVHEV